MGNDKRESMFFLTSTRTLIVFESFGERDDLF